MADKKLPNNNANKMAMSRALGAAFLNHQVEQLEKTVSANGPASGNWRDRRYQPKNNSAASPGSGKRAPASPNVKIAPRKGGEPVATPKERAVVKDSDYDRNITSNMAGRRRSAESDRKDADVVVVDASVLIHALYQVKKWCRDGREEIVIVPLEALNTLDLLKKGTSSLAQRARAASRILEAQVGTNTRIRVQRDDAFVLWDKIHFEDGCTIGESDARTAVQPQTCPEWVRRIICCARWETENPEQEFKPQGRRSLDVTNDNATVDTTAEGGKKAFRVVLAVLSTVPSLSPQSVTAKLADMSVNSELSLTPVPLPAPSAPQGNKHEPRSTGALVSSWAAKAGISLFDVDPAHPGRGDDDERPKRPHPHAHPHGPKGRRLSTNERGAKGGLVERPPAVMAMMEMVAQPSRVVRVLARGEKLDLDP